MDIKEFCEGRLILPYIPTARGIRTASAGLWNNKDVFDLAIFSEEDLTLCLQTLEHKGWTWYGGGTPTKTVGTKLWNDLWKGAGGFIALHSCGLIRWLSYDARVTSITKDIRPIYIFDTKLTLGKKSDNNLIVLDVASQRQKEQCGFSIPSWATLKKYCPHCGKEMKQLFTDFYCPFCEG